MQRADLTNACNLKNLKRADAERAVEKAKERLAKVFGIKVGILYNYSRALNEVLSIKCGIMSKLYESFHQRWWSLRPRLGSIT